MAKSLPEQIRELTEALAKTDAQLQVLASRLAAQEKDIERGARRDDEAIAKTAATDALIAQLRTEADAFRDELRRALDRLAASEARNAMLEERSRHGEKTADRGWQLWLAALGCGLGLVSLLVTAALQLKK